MRPVEDHFPITNPYGKPGPYAAGKHTGVDFGCPTGTPVKSPRRGRVVSAGWDNDYGNHVILQGWLGRKRFLMAHMSHISVRSGQVVKRGQVLGRTGDTGNSTGPHLHAEQRHRPWTYWDHERPTAFGLGAAFRR